MEYAKKFPLYENDTVCGSVTIGCDGLRCRFDCRCTPAGNGILRVYLRDLKGSILNLGPVVDDGAGFGTRRTLTRTELSAHNFDVYTVERCLLRDTPPEAAAEPETGEALESSAAKAEPDPVMVAASEEEPISVLAVDEEPASASASEEASVPVAVEEETVASEEEPLPVLVVDEEPASVAASEEEPVPVAVEEEPVASEEEPLPVLVVDEEPASVAVSEEEPRQVFSPSEESGPVYTPGEEPEPVFTDDATAPEPVVSLPEPEEEAEVFPGAAAYDESSELSASDIKPAVKNDFEPESAFREDVFHLDEADDDDGDLQQWKLCARPSDICRDEAVLSALSLADEVWMLREGDATWLGVPFDRNKPFGLHPAFTVARPVMVEDRLFAAVLVDRDGMIGDR